MLVSDNFESHPQDQRSEPANVTTEVDLEELAKRVFELLLQELEIENDRTGKS
jgi:hypothetical protein